MRTWTATTTVDAAPEAVLDVLTDPDAFARWAPLPFDVDDLTRRACVRLTARVSGRLAGRRVGFVVAVHAAESHGLSLRADGPVGLDVTYDLAATDQRLRGPRLRLRALRQGHHRPSPRGGHQRAPVGRRPHRTPSRASRPLRRTPADRRR